VVGYGALQHEVTEQPRVPVVDTSTTDRPLLSENVAGRFIDTEEAEPHQYPHKQCLAATSRARNDETVAHHSSDVDGIAKGARYARVPHGAAGNHPRARAARLATQDAARTTEPRCASHLRRPSAALEEAGLVSTEKVGRVRTCKLGPRRLEEETAWL